MLKRSKRIHGREAVGKLLKEGRKQNGRFFAIYKGPTLYHWNRYAVVVSKKIEKSAVKRNRMRRRIYEIIRLLEQRNEVPFTPASDIVLIVRQAALHAQLEELSTTLAHELQPIA